MATLETCVVPKQHAGHVTLHTNVLGQLTLPETVLLGCAVRPYRRSRTTGPLVKPLDDVGAVLWMEGGALSISHADVRGLFQHLLKREGEPQARHGTMRFDLGDEPTLRALGRRARYPRPEFHVSVVQPGVPKRRISDAQLNLLAVTELYLQETYGITFGMITSD